jgi:dTDP-4-dehydrorhamnose reductase
MRLIVTGRHGQLVSSLVERAAVSGVEVVCLGRPHIDLLQPDTVARAIESARGDIVINAAAYTAVDKAESEPVIAMRVNCGGARAVAAAAAKTGRTVVQISTDYVFDGALERPYREADAVGPISAYGRSKLEGEYAVAEAAARHVIVRTAWVYSPFGQNFLKTMLRLGATRGEISIVADQWGAPTSALDLADSLLGIARRLLAEPDNISLYGTFHVTAPNFTHWAGFADAIFADAATMGRKSVRVRPIATSEFPTPATRPSNSRLDSTKLQRVFGLALPDWRASTQVCVKRLLDSPRAEGLS